MPVYPFKCPKCGSELEFSLSVKCYELSLPPNCFEPGCDGQVEMQRVFTPVGIHFKGGGWTPKFGGSKG